MLKHKLEQALIVMRQLLPTLSEEIIKDTNIYNIDFKKGLNSGTLWPGLTSIKSTNNRDHVYSLRHNISPPDQPTNCLLTPLYRYRFQKGA